VISGVGLVMVTGFLGAALLGVAGASIGAAAGEAVENAIAEGVPEDEWFVYVVQARMFGNHSGAATSAASPITSHCTARRHAERNTSAILQNEEQPVQFFRPD
jgi:hypothetical protein